MNPLIATFSKNSFIHNIHNKFLTQEIVVKQESCKTKGFILTSSSTSEIVS